MPIEKQQRNALALCLTLAVVWGLGYIFIPMGLAAGATPSFLVFVRFFLSAVIYGLIFIKKIRITKKDLPLGVLAGALIAISFGLQTFGQQYTTPSNSAFLTSMVTVFLPFLTWVFFKKKPSYMIYVSLAVYTAGLAILSFKGGELHLNTGDILTLTSAVMFAFHYIVLVYAMRRSSNETLNFLQFATAGVLLGLFHLVFESGKQAINPIDWGKFALPILCLVLFSTVYAYSVQIHAQRLLPPYQVSIVLSLENVFGAVFSLAFGFEAFSWSLVAGGLLMFAAVVLAQLTPWTKGRRTKSKVVIKTKPEDKNGSHGSSPIQISAGAKAPEGTRFKD